MENSDRRLGYSDRRLSDRGLRQKTRIDDSDGCLGWATRMGDSDGRLEWATRMGERVTRTPVKAVDAVDSEDARLLPLAR